MKIIRTIKQMHAASGQAKSRLKKIGFVPTMGALHEGHLTLVRKSKKENDLTVVSIFVNPAQFGPDEDFTIYPREEKKDIFLLKKENVDIIFYPSANEMYPSEYLTYIEVAKISEVLCGQSRPGHFRGVATVVGKLLNIVSPDTIYLGQKDAQQCVVIRQMIHDLNFSVATKVVPTVREASGLAMSSRNQYLSQEQREEAAALYQVLRMAREHILKGEHRADEIVRLIHNHIQTHTSAQIEYAACVDAHSLESLKILNGDVLVALAVRLGPARLIDNIIVRLEKQIKQHAAVKQET